MSSYPTRNTCLVIGLLAVQSTVHAAPEESGIAQMPRVAITEKAPANGGTRQGYRVDRAQLGPFGERAPQDIPFTINTISGELIQNSLAANTSEALKYVPTAYSNTGASQITPYFTMRGFSASTWNYNIAVDGLRSFDIFEPMDDKERIEVMSGATGFLYGITSPAGMLNYVLKRPTSTPQRELTFGSYDRQCYGQLDLGGPIAGRQDLAYRLNLAYGDKGDTGFEHQSQERHTLSTALDWKVNPANKLSFDASNARRNLDYAQALFTTSAAIGIPAAPDATRNWGAPYTGATDATSRVGIALESEISDSLTLRAKLRYSDIERDYSLNRLVFQNRQYDYKWRVDMQQRTHTTVAQASLFLATHFATGPLQHELSLGATRDDFDAGNNGYRGTTYATSYPGTLYSEPGYRPWSLPPAGTSSAQNTRYDTMLLADQITLGQQWSLVLGATRAGIDDSLTSLSATGVATGTHYKQSRTTPAASLSFKPWPTLTTYASYVEALQQGFVAASTTANAGEVFAPFVSRQKEVGAKATLAGMALAAAYFHIEQANQYVDPVSNFASQDGQETHKGWEFSFSGRATSRLTLLGGLTLLDAKVDKASSNVGKIPQGVPERILRLFAEYDLPFVPGLTLTGGASHTGRVPWDAANTLFVDAVTIYDAGLRLQTGLKGHDTTWRLNVSNLGNKNYWTTRSSILYLGSPRIVSLSTSLAF